MKALHIAPGDSAGGSLAEAIWGAGQDDELLRLPSVRLAPAGTWRLSFSVRITYIHRMSPIA